MLTLITALMGCGNVDSTENSAADIPTVDTGTVARFRTAWFYDGDKDGYGDPATKIVVGRQPIGYVHLTGDCDDTNSAVHPLATEVANGIDDDCDGMVDEGATSSNSHTICVAPNSTYVSSTETWTADVLDNTSAHYNATYWYSGTAFVTGTGTAEVCGTFTAYSGDELKFQVEDSSGTDLAMGCSSSSGAVEYDSTQNKCSYFKVTVDGVRVTTFASSTWDLDYIVP